MHINHPYHLINMHDQKSELLQERAQDRGVQVDPEVQHQAYNRHNHNE